MYTPKAEIDALFDTLAGARNRFAIWRQPTDTLGKEAIFAIQVSAQAVDAAKEYAERLNPEAKYISLTAERLIETIDAIAQRDGMTQVLVYNLDLLLWRLKQDQREIFWETMLLGLPNRQRSLIFMLPAAGTYPREEAAQMWRQGGRMRPVAMDQNSIWEED